MDDKNKRDDSVKKLVVDLLSTRPIAYYPALARKVGGVQEAVMLSQLLYWHGDARVQERGGWIWKSLADMEVETGLTGLQQQTARRSLEALGVIECQLKGVPRTWSYKILIDRLIVVLSADHSEGNPLNGLPIEWSDQSTVSPRNIARNPRGMFTRETGQYSPGKRVNFNKNLETTNKTTPETTDKTTSSSSYPPPPAATTGNDEEEGLSVLVVKALETLGIFTPLYPGIRSTMVKRGLDDQQVIDLANRLLTKYDPERAASLFTYRLKELKKRKAVIGYTQSHFGTCSRCSRSFRGDFLAQIDGQPVCQDCLTDDEYQGDHGTDPS